MGRGFRFPGRRGVCLHAGAGGLGFLLLVVLLGLGALGDLLLLDYLLLLLAEFLQ